MPLLGEPSNRIICLWHKPDKKVKYRTVCQYEDAFEEIEVDAEDLLALKVEISHKLEVSGWADEKPNS